MSAVISPESLFEAVKAESGDDALGVFTVLTKALKLAQEDLRAHTGKLYESYPRTVQAAASLQELVANSLVEVSAIEFNVAPAIDRLLLQRYASGEAIGAIFEPTAEVLNEILAHATEMGLIPSWSGPIALSMDIHVYQAHLNHVTSGL